MSARIDILRPMDTERMGWVFTLDCDPCRMITTWTVPADLKRCNWAYVIRYARCYKCGTPTHRLRFDGPMAIRGCLREKMGEVLARPETKKSAHG